MNEARFAEINERALRLARRALDRFLEPRMERSRVVFVTISGAHIYGFPSADSDIDLRGAHVLPVRDMLGLTAPSETLEILDEEIDGAEVNLVSHDVRKYLNLLLKKNGYILEQVFSPLVVYDGGRLAELRRLARGAMTRHVVHHYKGFFRNQEKMVCSSLTPTVKSLLYAYRVVMSGLHLLRTGEVETNLLVLNRENHRFDFIDELVERKMQGKEKGCLGEGERDGLFAPAKELEAQLDSAAADSVLPDEPGNRAEINGFLLAVRGE